MDHNKILVVIDMQNDFITGSLGSKQAQEIVNAVCNKINQFTGKIYATQDTHDSKYLSSLEGKNLPVMHCVEHTAGWEIQNQIKQSLLDKSASFIEKKSFGYTEWNKIIPASVQSIELCGLCTSYCVLANAVILRAMFPDTPITIDPSCCACVSDESHLQALEVMKTQNITVL